MMKSKNIHIIINAEYISRLCVSICYSDIFVSDTFTRNDKLNSGSLLRRKYRVRFSGRIARVNGLNELKSHYAIKRFEIFGLRENGAI